MDEVEKYKEEIINMVKKIENPLILKLIYGFTKSGYKEEKAGRKETVKLTVYCRKLVCNTNNFST